MQIQQRPSLCNTKYFDRQKLFPHDTPDTKNNPYQK